MSYELVGDRVIRDDGWVALQHYNANDCTVQMEADGTLYTFSARLNCSFAWIRPQDVDTLLRVQARVCCGRHQNKFMLASLINANIWELGHM